jgi:hypothetical protein
VQQVQIEIRVGIVPGERDGQGRLGGRFHLARVPDAIAVGIALIGVGRLRAVVAGVAEVVAIAVPLPGVRAARAVVLAIGDAVLVGVEVFARIP